MSKRHTIQHTLAALTFGLLTLVACTDDTPDVGVPTDYLYPSLAMPVHSMADNNISLAPRWQQYEPTRGGMENIDYTGIDPYFKAANNDTRWYAPYYELTPKPINTAYTSIGVVMAQNPNDANAKNPATRYEGINYFFQYVTEPGVTNRWKSTVPVEKDQKYYIFGFMPAFPYNAASSIEQRDGSTDWADGAKVHLSQVQAITGADLCAIVGVLRAENDDLDINNPTITNQLNEGQFDYTAGEKGENYAYFLLDHLYCGVDLELMVDAQYAELRKIKLKQVTMRSPAVPQYVDINYEVVGKDDNDNFHNEPIQNVHYGPMTPVSGQPTATTQIFPAVGNEGIFVEPEIPRATGATEDTQPRTSVPGFFAPGSPTQQFYFDFEYDVYDAQGNLVRQNCTATNKWSLPNVQPMRGLMFKVPVRIKPTYLYQLSEPDLDNPTFKFE